MKSEIRVAYINQWFPKPSETFVFREVQTFKELGVEVISFSLYGRFKHDLTKEMSSFADVERIGIAGSINNCLSWVWQVFRQPARIRRLPRFQWDSPLKMVENVWALFCGARIARRCLELNVEHIHAPWAGSPATAALIASRLSGIPFSFAARAKDIRRPDKYLPEKLKSASMIRVNTGANLEFVRGLVGDQKDKVKLVYNALTRQFELMRSSRTEVCRLLAVGRLVEKKGFDDLLNACVILRDQGLSFHLKIAGDGPLRRGLKQQVIQLRLEQKVEFLGWVRHNQVSELFKDTDLMIAPSKLDRFGDRDGIPNVLIESLACGTPVVACPVGGIEELVIDRHTGLLAKPGEPESIADCIREMWDDADLANRTAQAGLHKVLEQFDPQANCTSLRSLFEACAPIDL